jgi:hypothetical protein
MDIEDSMDNFEDSDKDALEVLLAFSQDESLFLFLIINSSENIQYIIAKSTKYARIISRSSNHILEIDNGHVYRANDKFYKDNPGFGNAVKRAIRDKRPGVVERKGNYAIVGTRVYAPLSEVE